MRMLIFLCPAGCAFMLPARLDAGMNDHPGNEPSVTLELARDHNLTDDEYERIQRVLGRVPTYTELGIFSVMWSEHCSYKNTRPLLRTLPTRGSGILVGAGEENAGIIDIGDGLAIAFKIESHNHPSAVEPFQGAATGVGGIIRDIFTMGARPVCAMDSLRFGELSEPEVRRLFRGVVAGIAHYGNCFGIPTVAGEIYFDKSYEGNPLVNVFCLGCATSRSPADAPAGWATRCSMSDPPRAGTVWPGRRLRRKT